MFHVEQLRAGQSPHLIPAKEDALLASEPLPSGQTRRLTIELLASGSLNPSVFGSQELRRGQGGEKQDQGLEKIKVIRGGADE
jgi:hypothetical protein